jgi:hypothetical protein
MLFYNIKILKFFAYKAKIQIFVCYTSTLNQP